MYLNFAIDNQIKKFLEIKCTNKSNENNINNNKKVYFNLPFIAIFSSATKNKHKQICDKYCKNIDIVVAFSPLKTESSSCCKDSISIFF